MESSLGEATNVVGLQTSFVMVWYGLWSMVYVYLWWDYKPRNKKKGLLLSRNLTLLWQIIMLMGKAGKSSINGPLSLANC